MYKYMQAEMKGGRIDVTNAKNKTAVPHWPLSWRILALVACLCGHKSYQQMAHGPDHMQVIRPGPSTKDLRGQIEMEGFGS